MNVTSVLNIPVFLSRI